MMVFYAVLAGPSQKSLIRDLASTIEGGLVDTKMNWDSGKPMLFMGTVGDREAFEHADQFESLFAWADKHGIEVTVFQADGPGEGEDVDLGRAVDREVFRNVVERMKGVKSDVEEEAESEANYEA